MQRLTVYTACFALIISGCVIKAGPGTESAVAPVQTSGQSAATAQPVATAQPIQAQPAANSGQQGPSAQFVGQTTSPPTTASTGGSERSNFGTVSLASGFMPDPHVVQGTSGGNRQVENCAGWISNTPDHIFEARTAMASLRIAAHSDQDITLVVQQPSGAYLCNDDHEGLNPMVSGSFPAGRYRVWVGSYEQGVMAPYRLGFSELSTVTPSSLAPGGAPAQQATISTGGASNFGTVSLAPGFLPDPRVVQGTSGGAVAASQVQANCRGWISSTPDHILVAQGSFNPLRIVVRSDQDTTLVVADDNGNVVCDDDTEGHNPVVSANLQSGRYRIWVGSYNQGDRAAYRLGFSELSRVTPSSL